MEKPTIDFVPSKDPKSRDPLLVTITDLSFSPGHRDSYMPFHDFCLLVREYLLWLEEKDRVDNGGFR